jgi:NAD+ kinase
MQNSVLIFSRAHNTEAEKVAKEFMQWLDKKKISYKDYTHVEGMISTSEIKKHLFGIVFGGDGTFLTLVRKIEKKDSLPILGVNLGSLGFITEIEKSEMFAVVESILKNKFKEEKRPLLDIQLCRKNKCVQAGSVFNDAVITKDAKATMLKFELRVDDLKLSDVRADGFIVATPTGSTGYNLSAGGPLTHPQVSAIVLTAICSHALSARPIVVSDTAHIELELKDFTGLAYLVFDGQINYEIKPKDIIKIGLSKSYLRLIQSPRKRWAEIIRSKLSMS